MRKIAFACATAMALAGCTGSLAATDGVGPTDDVGGDTGSAQQQLTLGATDAIQIAGILGYELSGLLEGVPGLGEGDAMPGPSGSLPVGTGDCTDVDWEPENLLGVTVTFDSCVLDNGDVLDGGVAVRLGGAARGSVEIDFMDLAIGERFITGTMTLAVSLDDVRVDADLDYLDADTIMGIELVGVGMGIRGDGVHFNGDATIVENGERYHAVLSDVTWSLGNLCHPTDGSIDLTRPGEPAISVVFSPDNVSVQVGSEAPVDLPSAC
ncbi:MAG: hypothetical protein H6719_02360 [Sandaracinaceae bacterium]|nr:hypothetical protein [Sandaracinaceae bacterium]